ncbi:hypothetical protein NL676_026085 [Syzygium grande]|nr:hypothetical protein NL676_026085 [Syzygium grande]
MAPSFFYKDASDVLLMLVQETKKIPPKINQNKPVMASSSQKQPSMLFLACVLLMLVPELPCLASSRSSSPVALVGAGNPTGNEDAAALLAWKATLDGQSHHVLSSWNKSNPCSWRGIDCNPLSSIASLEFQILPYTAMWINLVVPDIDDLQFISPHQRSIGARRGWRLRNRNGGSNVVETGIKEGEREGAERVWRLVDRPCSG